MKYEGRSQIEPATHPQKKLLLKSQSLLGLTNQKCEIQPTIINLNPNEYTQRLRYYPFAVNIDRCVSSCNSLIGLSNKVYVPNKTEDLNLICST